MKRELEKISQTKDAAKEIPESHVESGEQRPHRQGPITSRTYPEICIFVKRKLDIKKVQERAILSLSALTCVDLT